MYVSDDSWVFEVDQGIVDKKSTSGRGVEDVEIGVFDPSVIEIGGGESLSMKGGGVFASALAANANQMSVFVNAPVTDILGSLRLSFLVEEDDRVKVGLSSVIPYPPFTRVVGILKVTSEWGSKTDRLRG